MKQTKIRILASSYWLLSISLSFAQSSDTLTIDECYTLAKENYPLVHQMELIEKTKDYSVSNASKNYLPQINFAGQATYQSDVTSIPIALPNLNITSLSKDQYKIYGEINQPLTDVFVIKQQKEYIKTTADVEEQKLEVELYKLKERINQLFFGILLIDAQIEQIGILQKDLQSALEKTNAAIDNGLVLKSNADLLKAELLKVKQHKTELQTNRKGFANTLALFIHQEINEETIFESPKIESASDNINRLETKLLDTQKKSFDIQKKLITAKNLPRLNLFLQTGYGRPALNFLNNDFDFYYIGGIRFNWNISGFYTFKKDKQLLAANQNILDIQKETFLFNTNMVLTQQNSEVSKLEELIDTDKEIITLRERIKTTAKSQLENGVITTHDYLTFVNAEDQAKQNLLLHQIQLKMAQYNYQTTSGN